MIIKPNPKHSDSLFFCLWYIFSHRLNVIPIEWRHPHPTKCVYDDWKDRKFLDWNTKMDHPVSQGVWGISNLYQTLDALSEVGKCVCIHQESFIIINNIYYKRPQYHITRNRCRINLREGSDIFVMVVFSYFGEINYTRNHPGHGEEKCKHISPGGHSSH